MLRPRQLHFIVGAVLLLAAFLFLLSSWDTDNVELGEAPGKVRVSSSYEAKENEAELAGEVVVNTRDWKQEVLDGLAATKATVKSPSPETSILAKLSTSKSLLLSTASRRTPAALATSSPVPLIPHPDPSKITPTYDRVIVIGKLESENIDWVYHKFPDWQHAVYTIDSPSSGRLHTLMDKGHEAMPYLTYIIEHYDRMPAIVVFLNSQPAEFPKQAEREGYEFDTVEKLRKINLDFVHEIGYANLRCVENPGCPAQQKPFQDPREGHVIPEKALLDAWRELFNTSRVPDEIRAPCCSQFAVSRKQILKRPMSDYRKYLDWLMRTPLDDDTSKAVFEYLWHVIFGMEPVYCPNIAQCHCDLYRKC